MKYAWESRTIATSKPSAGCAGFVGIAFGVLPLARAGAQRAVACQPGSRHHGGGHPSGQPPQLRPAPDRAATVPESQAPRPAPGVPPGIHMVTIDSGHRLPIAANLLDRLFDGRQPNRSWVGTSLKSRPARVGCTLPR